MHIAEYKIIINDLRAEIETLKSKLSEGIVLDINKIDLNNNGFDNNL